MDKLSDREKALIETVKAEIVKIEAFADGTEKHILCLAFIYESMYHQVVENEPRNNVSMAIDIDIGDSIKVVFSFFNREIIAGKLGIESMKRNAITFIDLFAETFHGYQNLDVNTVMIEINEEVAYQFPYEEHEDQALQAQIDQAFARTIESGIRTGNTKAFNEYAVPVLSFCIFRMNPKEMVHGVIGFQRTSEGVQWEEVRLNPEEREFEVRPLGQA